MCAWSFLDVCLSIDIFTLWMRIHAVQECYGAFPLQGAVWFGSQRCGTDCVSTAKSGCDPVWAVLVLPSSSVLLIWGTWRGAGKFELHTPSVDWSTESSLPGDLGIKTNKQTNRFFRYMLWRKPLIHLRNVCFEFSGCFGLSKDILTMWMRLQLRFISGTSFLKYDNYMLYLYIFHKCVLDF
jgi:hypothetical protein